MIVTIWKLLNGDRT